MRITRLLLPLGVAGLIGGAGGAFTATQLADPVTPVYASASGTTAAETISEASGVLSAGEVYDRSKDSVAHITAEVTRSATGPLGAQPAQGKATGSGFVISDAGLIVTNAHVIDGADRVWVRVGDGERVEAEIVGTDTSSDIALLRIETDGQDLAALRLADSETVEVGDATYAIGSPYGLDRTLTGGLVSALHRSIEAPDGYAISNVIQTDAALNPGNSGGPLLDDMGRVVGVNSQIETSGSSAGGAASNTGLGFAVPSNTVKRVVEQLRETGEATHAYLGVSTGDTQEPVPGALIGEVREDGPAAAAKLRAGDVVTAIDDLAVDDAETLTSALDAHQPGDEVSLAVVRGGKEQVVEVELGTRPAAS